MKTDIFRFSILVAIFIGGSGLLSASAAEKKPNIIFIMVDDMGYGDLGVYGQKLIQTPNIDDLARRGMRFTDYYSGSTVCAPSREALLTGMHTGHTYIRGNFLTNENEDPAMPPEKVTIAEILKENGYCTGLVGKWGLGGEDSGPDKQGFNYSYGYLDQIKAHNYYPSYLYENGKKILLEENQNGAEEIYSHDLFIEKTTQFINDSNQEEPFFLYLPYTIPHGKHVIPNNEPYANKDWPENNKNYAAMITRLDSDIGDLVDLLKHKDLDKNTLIFFTSDNGANAQFAKFFGSNGKFRGHKTTLYEGGIRVPLIAYWPTKIQAGQVSNHISAAWDVLPTICEIAGVSAPRSIDGISFYPTLFGKKNQKKHAFLYWEYFTYNYNWNVPESKLPRNWLESRAVRMGKWKAVSKSLPQDDRYTVELYNLELDQEERNDVASTNPDIIKKIKNIFSKSSTQNAPFFPYKVKN